MSSMGEWTSFEEEIKIHIRNNFLKLFSTDLSHSFRTLKLSQFSCAFLFEEDKENINKEVT